MEKFGSFGVWCCLKVVLVFSGDNGHISGCQMMILVFTGGDDGRVWW